MCRSRLTAGFAVLWYSCTAAFSREQLQSINTAVISGIQSTGADIDNYGSCLHGERALVWFTWICLAVSSGKPRRLHDINGPYAGRIQHKLDIPQFKTERLRKTTYINPFISSVVAFPGSAIQEEASFRPSTMVLPSAIWAEAILKHADMKRKKLRNMVKHGEVAAGWEGKWERLPLARRRRLLEDVRDELVHAVSLYVGRDEALFNAVW